MMILAAVPPIAILLVISICIFTLLIVALTLALYRRHRVQHLTKTIHAKKKILNLYSNDIKKQKSIQEACSKRQCVKHHINSYAQTPLTDSTVHAAIELILAFKHARKALDRPLPSRALFYYTDIILSVEQAFLDKNPLSLSQEYILKHKDQADSLHYAHTLTYYFATYPKSHYIKAMRILAGATATPKQLRDAYASTTRAIDAINTIQQPGAYAQAAYARFTNRHLIANPNTHLPFLIASTEKKAIYALHLDLCCQLGLRKEAEQIAQTVHQLMPESLKALQILMMHEYEKQNWEPCINYMSQLLTTVPTVQNSGTQTITHPHNKITSAFCSSNTTSVQPVASLKQAQTSKNSLLAQQTSHCKTPIVEQIIAFLQANNTLCTRLLDDEAFQNFYGNRSKNTHAARINDYMHALYHAEEFHTCLDVAEACLSLTEHLYATVYAGNSQLQLKKYTNAEVLLSKAIKDTNIQANTDLYCFALEGLIQLAKHGGQQGLTAIHTQTIERINPNYVIGAMVTPSIKLYPVHLSDKKHVSLSATHGVTHLPLDLANQVIDPIIDMVLDHFKNIQRTAHWTSITFPTSSMCKEQFVRTIQATIRPSENYLTSYRGRAIKTKFERDTSLTIDFVHNLSLAKNLDALFRKHNVKKQGFLDGLVEAYPKHFPIPGIMMDQKGCFYAFFWHGSRIKTPQSKSKQDILQTGLLLNYASPGNQYGKGIYASPTFAKARQYSSHTMYFLLYNLGTNPEITDDSCAGHSEASKPPFTSKMAKRHNKADWEIILYEDKKHLPLFMLENDGTDRSIEDIRITCKKQCKQNCTSTFGFFFQDPANDNGNVQCRLQ